MVVLFSSVTRAMKLSPKSEQEWETGNFNEKKKKREGNTNHLRLET